MVVLVAVDRGLLLLRGLAVRQQQVKEITVATEPHTGEILRRLAEVVLVQLVAIPQRIIVVVLVATVLRQALLGQVLLTLAVAAVLDTLAV